MLNTFRNFLRLRAISKIVRRMTSGSERIFVIFSKPLIRIKNDTPLERYRRGAYFSYLLFSLIHYGLRAVSNLLNRGILFFKKIQIFDTVFAPVF